MSKVIVVYESHSDRSAVLVLQKLLCRIKGKVTLCLETPPGNVFQDITTAAKQLKHNIEFVKGTLKSGDKTKIEKCFKQLIGMGAIGVNGEKIRVEEVIKGLQDFQSSSKQQYICMNETLKLINIAKEGKENVVVGIDLPLAQRHGSDSYFMGPRNKYMYEQLLKLSKTEGGVIIYLVGLAHADVAEALRKEGVVVTACYPHEQKSERHPEYPGRPEECINMVVDAEQIGELNQEKIASFASQIEDSLTTPAAGVLSTSVSQSSQNNSPVALGVDEHVATSAAEHNRSDSSSQPEIPAINSGTDSQPGVSFSWSNLAIMAVFFTAAVAGVYLLGVQSHPLEEME
jgi:hypothetical protein